MSQLSTQFVAKPTGRGKRLFNRVLILVILAAIYVWAFAGVETFEIKETAGQISKAILNGIIQPDWDFVPGAEGLIYGLIDTLAISILGTFISAILTIPFGFWAATRRDKSGFFVTGIGRFVLSFIRVFPEVVLAIIFIKAVGPGSFAGVLALGLHSIGMLGKLFAEEVEAIDHGPKEALIATGANRLQVLVYSVLPQVLPGFISYTLYRFELNVRGASILGIIGAGGIGAPLIFALQSRNWPRVGVILLGIIVLVSLIDLISGYFRKKIV
ncbi:phosphonate ABC transporter, permease protein PhnE [Terribacillus halophilus]|uniref:phosphonate ABC transporter, permease protein PhnE n=1 Tax=Terribacillus halophilus TaxID=361279 RepID=UPI0009860476|nr:phosphonate ABC transporter, permease protein PhnE [Terribacillus halophilus]